MGRPRLFVGVSAGNLDSMLNKLTAQKKMRSRGSVLAGRPHRTCARTARRIVYSNLCRQAFPGAAHRARRHRGVAPAHRALRLLVGLGAPLDPARRQGRSARLRHGRARRRGRSRGGSHAGETRRARSRDIRGTAHVIEEPRASGSRSLADAEPLRDRRQGRRPAVVRGGARATSARSRAMSRAFQYETNAAQRRGRSSRRTATRRSTSTRPPLPLAEAEMDGALRSAVRARAAPRATRRARSPRSRR